MKLHNLSVIFVIIAIPLILITSYYISLQIDTINMQTAYNTKLLDSTKEAIDAFEINTVEWNANYSETADSKRRDVMASINTFINSFANNLGVTGTSRESIMAYMPAIAYTLYDGYYIYSPANTKVAIKDDNGVGVVMTEKLCNDGIIKLNSGYKEEYEGKLLYEVATGHQADGTYNETKFTLDQEKAATEYKHILKPFAMYSEKVGDWVINYTLDNYITIYGNVENQKTEGKEFVSKAGYLSIIDDKNGIQDISENKVSGVKYKGTILEPEFLSERVAYKENENVPVIDKVFNYVYEADGNTKVYFDGDQAFVIGSNLVRTDLSEQINRYKKVTIPQYKSGSWTYKEIYQSLYDGKWYDKDKRNIIADGAPGYDIKEDKKLDYSAINYCVESYIVTKFVNSLKIKSAGGSCICGYNHGNSLAISSANNPELEDSDFSLHKRGIIKNVIESNLNQAITSYSRNSREGDYKLPKLTETDWDQILRNVSIITFIQNIPIGMKYYNNYAIATSTMNKEYVDPEEIYLNAAGDEYYHMPYCKHLEKTKNMIGYRSIDYVQKSYTLKEKSGENETKYYYKHSNTKTINVNQACYYCLVQKSLYEENKTSDKTDAYNTALARERYVARMAKLPAEVEASYYINVTPYTIEEGEEIVATTAQYSINGATSKGKGGVKINKEIEEYVIEPTFGEEKTLGGNKSTDDLGSFDNTAKTISGADFEGDNYSVYKSDSYANVTTKYNPAIGVTFSVDAWNEDAWTTIPEDAKNTKSFSPEADGYINIKLKYEKNYTSGGEDSRITAFTNIEDINGGKSKITIVTNTGDITGYVRLRFTNINNEGKTVIYYSKDIFNITKTNSSIYCEIIDNELSWYKKDWQVDVLNVAGESIKSTKKMEYYTLRNKAGLEAFSQATNNEAKTKGRTFYLIKNIDMNNEEINPICQNTDNWFDGYFGSGIYYSTEGYVEKGGQYTISNLKIDVNNDAKNTFGLFGLVGKPATIENLKISNIEINTNNVKGKYKVGGLAGFADAGNYINNVIVENSSITGSAYVGGIIGHSKKEIKNCEIRNTDVSSIGTENVIEVKGTKYNTIYVGGIVGLTEGQAVIDNCKVRDNSKIGEGSISIDGNFSINKDRYYVGGIVGYAENIVNNPTVEESITVKGGAIKGTAWDDKKETYTGGVIGYKDTNQKIDGSFNVRCNVSGHDNVGGIIGFNAGGDINNVSFNGSLQGDGENIGGIVGCNTGGTISNCENTVDINVSGENVGGIVGCNYNANIIKCYNNKAVTGNKNVGGIAGVCYGGTIDYCGNNKDSTIIGNGNTNYLGFYYTAPSDCTGTGGIAGKIYRAKVLHSYNLGNIKCNYNGGGISGLNNGSTVEYSYNSGTISSTSRNRIGGICGAGDTVYINACYNIGTVNGNGDIDVLSNGMGGIIGTCVDNAYFLFIGKEEVLPENKYFDSIEVPVVKSGQTINVIVYCYNTASLNGSTGSDALNHACGIIGCIFWAPNKANITLEGNYYLDNRENGAKGSWSNIVSNGVTKLSSGDMKQQLYRWADSLKVPEGEQDAGKFIYNTIAPVETDKGYEGYGVLWWEIEDYVKLETFIGVGDNEEQATKVIDDSNTTLTIGGKSVKLHDEYNIRKYKNKLDLHCWICYVKKDVELKAKASADYYDDSNEETISISEDGIKLLLLGGKSAKIILYPSGDASLDWIRTRTFTRECTQKEYYRTIWRVRTKRITEKTDTKSIIGRWDSSTENAGKLIKELSKPTLLEEDGNFGYVKLSGDGTRKFTLDNYDVKIEEYDAKGTFGKYSESPTKTKTENVSGDTELVTGVNSGVKFIVPIENIIDKTKNGELPFNRDTSKITYGKAVVNIVYFHYEKGYDGPGATPEDPAIVNVQFGNQEGQSQRKNLEWDWFSTKDSYNKKTFVFEFSESKDIPENIIVDFEWGADVTHMHVGIDNAYVEVNYKQ